MSREQEFKEAVEAHGKRLGRLMDDPQWGLSTWGEMLGREMKWLTKWWKGEFADNHDWRE